MSQSPTYKSSVSKSRRNASATHTRTLDRLEERMLLSAALSDLGAGGAWIRWGNAEIPVSAGSYIVTFDNYMGNAQADLLAREVATRLGVSATDFQAVGRGGQGQLRRGRA